ncbi:hypothetical protein [Christensenella massiliensis]|uniref:Uncharacterized protein n=1 Tax=Christensenella massiliensis TaxID=1805714 RepID=A0AAU8A690_9FIRM
MPLTGGIYSDQIAFHIIAFLKEKSALPVKGRVVIRSFVALGYLENDVERTLLEMYARGYFTKTNPDSQKSPATEQRARVFKITGVTKNGMEFFANFMPPKKKSRFMNMSTTEMVSFFVEIASMTMQALELWLR